MKILKLIYLLLFIQLIFIQISHAKDNSIIFNVTTGEHVYAIGHPIDVIFETRNHSRSLSTLNVDVLSKNFVIHDFNVDKFEDVINGELTRIENLVVRLYPRRSGRLKIPAFKLGRYKSNPIFLDIINDFNSSIQIRTTMIKKSFYQREPINIYVDVFYRQKKISSSIGELKDKNFIISDVVKTEYIIRDNGLNLPVDRFSWIVIPLLEGDQTINLPMIKTGGRRMYPSGKIKIKVKPLPSTLPSLAPVSKQTITKNNLPSEKIWINKVYYWSLSLEGIGLNENILEKIISQQLETDSSIRYFPRTYKQTRIDNGSKFRIDIKIPFKLFNAGEFKFPIIDIPYIDNETGLLEHTFASEKILNATSNLNENFKTILSIILFILILIQPLVKIINRLHIKYRYRMCYFAVAISNNPKKIKNSLLKLTPRFNVERSLTLKSWEETAAISNPEQRKTLNKISMLLNNFNYGKRFSKNEIAVLKRLVKSLI